MIEMVKADCLELWNSSYVESETATHYKTYFPTIYHKADLRGLSKRYQSAIYRIQTGHCGLNGHLNRLNIKDSPLCQSCGVTEDVKHFIMECPRYSQEREYLKQMCTNGDQLRLHDVLTKRELYMALGDFLMSTGRFI